ncbi:MAG TPA: PEGA domain-containing protein [Fibrobacteraceae bacterium]|nr:PEGA domain-containing protein [Fibrobacteraceae bacterium]
MRPIWILGVILGLLAPNLVASPVPARFILPDGQEQLGMFLKLQADTVFYTLGEGDSLQQFAVFKFDLKKVQLTENDSLVDLNLNNFEVTTKASVDTLSNDTTPTLAKGDASLIVNSFPQNSRVYIDNILMDGITPLVVPNLQATKHTVMVRQYLKGVDWWGSAEVEIKAKDTTRVVIKLLKPHTQLKVQTVPSGAEFYLDGEPSISQMPTTLSDTTLMDVTPGPDRTIRFFKVGYYDTSVTLSVDAFMPNLIGMDLKRVTDDLPLLGKQVDFVQHRKRKWIGRGFLWSSIAPLVTSGVMLVLADRDWNKATDYKSSYEDAAFESSETDRFVSRNSELNDSGDLKAKIAAGFGAGALLLATVGIVLQF